MGDPARQLAPTPRSRSPRHQAHPPRMRCEHYAISPTTPVRALRCRRRATVRVRVGGAAREWAVCDGCRAALDVLWGGAVASDDHMRPGATAGRR